MAPLPRGWRIFNIKIEQLFFEHMAVSDSRCWLLPSDVLACSGGKVRFVFFGIEVHIASGLLVVETQLPPSTHMRNVMSMSKKIRSSVFQIVNRVLQGAGNGSEQV